MNYEIRPIAEDNIPSFRETLDAGSINSFRSWKHRHLSKYGILF